MVTFQRDEQSDNAENAADAEASAGDEIRHLQRALQSQPVIEQAKGLLIAQHGCTPDEAFAMLTQASQRENRKLRDIARAMIDGAAPGAADRRVLAADARDRAADARDRAADERDVVIAQERADVDAVIARAVLRDRSAEQRDRRADQRDLLSDELLAGSAPSTRAPRRTGGSRPWTATSQASTGTSAPATGPTCRQHGSTRTVGGSRDRPTDLSQTDRYVPRPAQSVH